VRKEFLQRGLTAAAILAFTAVTAFAEEGGSPANQPIGLKFKWIHFVMIALGLLWLFGKVLPPIFRGNAESISAAIAKATAARAEADRQMKEAAFKMASLDKEIKEFRATAEREAKAEAERLKNSTQNDAAKIVLAAKAEIAAAERAARAELKVLAAKLAVDGAESLVVQQMSPAVQETLIHNFVQSMQGRPN
jgi:F-type H+-transporting ATPase subunit b